MERSQHTFSEGPELIKRSFEDKKSIQRNFCKIIDSQIEKITKIIQQLVGFVRKKNPSKRPWI